MTRQQSTRLDLAPELEQALTDDNIAVKRPKGYECLKCYSKEGDKR